MIARSYLLDTNVMIWLDGDRQRIADAIVQELSQGVRLYYSAASAWEAAIKRASGKLRLNGPISLIAKQLNLTEMPITSGFGEAAARLPLYHRDPFDRMLVAQARSEGLVLVTSDAELRDYDVEILMVK